MNKKDILKLDGKKIDRSLLSGIKSCRSVKKIINAGISLKFVEPTFEIIVYFRIKKIKIYIKI